MLKVAKSFALLTLIVGCATFYPLLHANPLLQRRALDQNCSHLEVEEKFCPAAEEESETKKQTSEQGSRVNSKCTPLMRAAENGDLQAVRDLLKKGADVNVKPGAWPTALMLAAKEGQLEIVKILLAAGANPNEKIGSFHWGDGQALMSAMDPCTKNRFAIMDAMIAAGAEVNPTGEFGRSPLTYAIGKRDKVMFKALIARGADVNLKNSNGTTPLMVAAMSGLPEMVKLLLSSGAKVNARDLNGDTALTLVQQLQKEQKADVFDEVILLLRKATRVTLNRNDTQALTPGNS